MVLRLVKKKKVFGVDNSSPEHADRRLKDIFTFGRGPTNGLDDNIVTEKAKHSINYSEQQNKFYFSVHSNGSNSFWSVKGVRVYKLKTKDSEK